MSRKTNEQLYVKLKRDPNEEPARTFCEKHGLPPVKNLIICAAITLGSALAVVLLLMLTGLRLTTLERADGVEAKYFGWMSGDVPTLGVIQFSDGQSANVGGGQVVYSDGSVYVGEMKGLSKHGLGTLVYADGTKYEGWFKDDLYHCESSQASTITYSNGSRYEGGFKNGKYDGYGILTESTGTTYKGLFEGGELSEKEDISVVYYDGSKFVGKFKDGMRSEGIYTWGNGESISGMFVNNIPDPLDRLKYTKADGSTYSVQIVGGIIVKCDAYTEKEDSGK